MQPEINTNVPQSARVYDYWLGGKDNFPADRALGDAIAKEGGIANVPRSLADTEPFFAGLELVEPGLVPLAAWRPDPGADQDPRSVYAYGGVARKP
jgi:hypothetical protein